MLVLGLSESLLGSPGRAIKVGQAHLAQSHRMQVGREYVVVLVDPDPGAIQRPTNECTLVFAETGTSAGQALRASVDDVVLPPTDAGPAAAGTVSSRAIDRLLPGAFVAATALAWMSLRRRHGATTRS